MKMKKVTGSLVAGLLLAGAGLANAAEPVALTDSQMDSVAAGAIGSISFGASAALLGFAASASTTSAVVTATSYTTSASSAALAAGLLPIATTGAASVIR
jgi:hypothetical protein